MDVLSLADYNTHNTLITPLSAALLPHDSIMPFFSFEFTDLLNREV